MSLQSLRSCCLLFISLPASISAEYDPSQGTYECNPCNLELCGFEQGDKMDYIIDPQSLGFGLEAKQDVKALTCREIQSKADAKMLDPELCSIYKQVTLRSDDPCKCLTRKYALTPGSEIHDKPCRKIGNKVPMCGLCGGGKIIGDPYKILGYPAAGASCHDIYMSQVENSENGGYPAQLCSDLQVEFGKKCQCVKLENLNEVLTCIGQERADHRPCEQHSDCCFGECRYRVDWKKHGKVCTGQPDQSHMIEQTDDQNLDDEIDPLDEPICFPSNAQVERKDDVGTTTVVRMKDLNRGDLVHIGGGHFEPVYTFGHYAPDVVASYLKIMPGGLEISANHLIATPDRGMIPAGHLKVGDMVFQEQLRNASSTGSVLEPMQVQEIVSTEATGAFAPFTPSGKLVVDGLLVSSYALVDDDTPLTFAGVPFYQFAANAFEIPHRMACYYTTALCTEAYDDHGVNVWVAPFIPLVEHLAQLPNMGQTIVAGIVLTLFLGLAVAEHVMLYLCHPLSLLFGIAVVSRTGGRPQISGRNIQSA